MQSRSQNKSKDQTKTVKKLRIIVKGLVQGVFFRANTEDVATSLGLTGWVKNLPNGDVEIFAEGDEQSLKKLLEWAKKGPPSARVSRVIPEWKEGKREFDDFRIIYY